MALTFPDWWDGGFPDVELVTRQILLPFMELVSPSPDVVAWLPDDYYESLPLVSVTRMPGEADGDTLLDCPEVLVSCVCKTRADSWELSEYVRQILLSYDRGVNAVDMPGGRKALIAGIKEREGPQLSPLSDFDERITTASYLISTKRHTTDYTKIRKSL